MSSTTLTRPAPATVAAPAPTAPSAGHYRARHRRRRLALGAVRLTAWLSMVATFTLYFADRGFTGWGSAADAMKSAGILVGLVTSTLMCLMVLLASRVPVVERLLGQDRALAEHGGLGTWVVGGSIAHGLLLLVAYAMGGHTTVVAEFTRLWGFGDFALAVVATALLVLVGATSALLSVRRHLPYELWFGVHLTTYAAVALSIPHQFTMDALFRTTWAKALWVGMYAVTAFCLLAYRIVLPLATSSAHRLVVTRVEHEAPGTVTVEMTGRNLHELGATGGQFLSWRFWTPGLVPQSHPYSLSAAPTADRLRITVKAAGRGSARLASLRPGTRVSVQGPYGTFTDASRTRDAVVMLGSGSGIAPVRALLESTATVPGRSLVVLRAGRGDDVLHFDEFRRLCRERGVQLVTLVGPRGDGWVPASTPGLTLVQLAPWLADADVYACGPEAWVDAVAAEATRYGVGPDQLHREVFSW